MNQQGCWFGVIKSPITAMLLIALNPHNNAAQMRLLLCFPRQSGRGAVSYKTGFPKG